MVTRPGRGVDLGPLRAVSRPGRAVPRPVSLSIAGWLTAVAAGVAESLVRLVLPEPPTSGELAGRAAIYAAVVALVLALRTGRNSVRWLLAVLLGGLGTTSLVIEPVSWLLGGGSVGQFLAGATAPMLVAAGLRVGHLLAVLTALILMFRPAASAFFRPTGVGPY